MRVVLVALFLVGCGGAEPEPKPQRVAQSWPNPAPVPPPNPVPEPYPAPVPPPPRPGDIVPIPGPVPSPAPQPQTEAPEPPTAPPESPDPEPKGRLCEDTSGWVETCIMAMPTGQDIDPVAYGDWCRCNLDWLAERFTCPEIAKAEYPDGTLEAKDEACTRDVYDV